MQDLSAPLLQRHPVVSASRETGLSLCLLMWMGSLLLLNAVCLWIAGSALASWAYWGILCRFAPHDKTLQNTTLHKRTAALVHAITRTTAARRGPNPRQLRVRMRLPGCLCLVTVVVPSLNSNLQSVSVCTCLTDCLVSPSSSSSVCGSHVCHSQ